MTNGEKIKVTFPHYDIEIEEHKGYVRVFYEDFYTTYPLRWWNAEYKEPTTKNNLLSGHYCSKCMFYVKKYYNYCPNCGAKMVEPQESEDKE